MKRPFAEVVLEMRRRRERIVAHVHEVVAREGGFKAKRKRGGFVTITRSTRPGVAFQLTFWDDEVTPTGHLDEADARPGSGRHGRARGAGLLSA